MDYVADESVDDSIDVSPKVTTGGYQQPPSNYTSHNVEMGGTKKPSNKYEVP